MEHTRELTFEQQQELNYIRDAAMGKACAGLTTTELNHLNPNLIASAPDLYEALKELREWIQSDDVKFLGKGFTEQFGIPKTFGKVDKALAKAEGKE